MELTQEIVRELLDYDPETGKLTWKERDVKWFTLTGSLKRSAEWKCKNWNSRWAGKEAFTSRNLFGHLEGRIFGQHFLAHRVIFCLVNGYFPKSIDHYDNIASSNKVENLIDSTQEENMKNKRKQSNNSSGRTGVRKLPSGRFRATINDNKKTIHLGYFSSFEEACEVRKLAEIKYGYNLNPER